MDTYTVVQELWNNKGESTNLLYKTAQDAKDAIPNILINHSGKYYYKPRKALQLEDGSHPYKSCTILST